MRIVSPWRSSGSVSRNVPRISAGRGPLEFAAKREETCPEPVERCGVRMRSKVRGERRRDDDHLFVAAGISNSRMNELGRGGDDEATGRRASAARPETRSGIGPFLRPQQVRLQVETLETGKAKLDLLPVEPGFGLAGLPEPSGGDVFPEGDPCERGLEGSVRLFLRGGPRQAPLPAHPSLLAGGRKARVPEIR